jgi:tRNA/tmRNA/rRNA uracil-C5-methylase (TrmA/RlmC/RlmD family)
MRTVELKIEDIGFGGKGVARENGKVVFVPFTIDGETVSAQIVREKKQFAEAELVDLREGSPHRVEPKCRYFGRCGGCAYQHMDYEHQLAIKSRQVRDVLQRIGKLKDASIQPIVPSPFPYAYRNRITVHAQDGLIGYFRRDSHRLIDVEHCPIALDDVNRQLAELRTRRVPDGDYTLRAKLTKRSEKAFHHFKQTNDAAASALRELIVRMVPPDQKLLIDVYCGAGFFAKSLLDKFQHVIGIDWDRFAIDSARKNATTKESYVAGDADTELAALAVGRDSVEPTTLIVDPPAAGLSANICKSIVTLAPCTLLYVSCNPATVARDLQELQQKFRIDSVTPLDMFPQTAEIEVVVHMFMRKREGRFLQGAD